MKTKSALPYFGSDSEFVRMFCDHMKVIPTDEVTRIKFEYVEDEIPEMKVTNG